MIALIDNYDSFTYNLVQAMAGRGTDVRVFRNDAVSVDEVASMKPSGIVISPGPCTPSEAGISVSLVRALSGVAPILGVCLGHQCIGAAFGGRVAAAGRIMHGKTSSITHEGGDLYRGMPNPFIAGRYHSLSIMEQDFPDILAVDARSDDGEIMGIHHKEHPTFGVQYHPESILTPAGKLLIVNFLRIARSIDESLS